MNWLSLISLFTLGFSSLFPLINPLGTALILQPMFSGRTAAEKRSDAFGICIYGLLVGLASLFAGSWILRFMGVSVPMTQLGGGLIIARMGLSLLEAKEAPKESKPKGDSLKSSLFYPLAFPLTLGPGAISVLITLSAHAHGNTLEQTFLHQGVLALSLIAVMILAYFCFAYSDFFLRRISESGSMALNRIIAFLVFCIGLQVAVGGLTRVFPHLE